VKPAKKRRYKNASRASDYCGPNASNRAYRAVSSAEAAYKQWYEAKFNRRWLPEEHRALDGYRELDAATGKVRVSAGAYGKWCDQRDEEAAAQLLPIAA
jgi:hypothetical protein